jgi:DNA topoisomerase III
MGKKLIIAEKPSVANDIARALGGFARKGDYFESDEYVLSSAVGHLLELAVPEEFDVKRGKWSFKHLPVLPPRFELSPLEKSEQRLNVLLRLMKRKDVTGLVNACDAGREGELIFRYIVQHARVKKPIERLWLQSMTQQSIRDGFSRLRADKDLLPLADAAKSRSEADWLVGINGTRAMTAFNSKEGGFYLTTVGRVQTPTLAILVEREDKIRAFTARDYWEVHARLAPRPANTLAAGSSRISRRTMTASARLSAFGTPSGPARSSPLARARKASPAKRPSPRPSSRRCCSISPVCSGKPTDDSDFPPA